MFMHIFYKLYSLRRTKRTIDMAINRVPTDVDGNNCSHPSVARLLFRIRFRYMNSALELRRQYIKCRMFRCVKSQIDQKDRQTNKLIAQIDQTNKLIAK